MSAAVKPAPKEGLKIKVGDRVLITTVNKPGTIRFIGTAKFKPGKWIGMELDDDTGKNDGSVAGTKYFICKPNHGLFVKPSMIKPLSAGTEKSAAKPTSRISSGLPAGGSDATAARRDALAKKKAELAAKKAAASSSSTAAAATEKKTSSSPTKVKAQAAASAESASVAALEMRLKEANETIDELTQELARKPAAGSSSDSGASAGLLEAQAAQEKKLKAELDAANSELKQLREELSSQKAKLVDMDDLKKKAAELVKLKATVEMMKSEKELSEETIEELSLELENATKEAEVLTAELEDLRTSKAADVDSMISSLPAGQAEIARIVEQNKALTEALRKLRDQAVTLQQKFDNLKEDTDQELEELRSKAIKVDKLDEELSNAKEAMAELRESLDEAHEAEQIVESLSDKNMDLLDANKQLERNIVQLKSLVEASEEMEEEHVELEAQLQTELEAQEAQVRDLHRSMAGKQSLIDDLNATNRQFRTLVKELEAENADLMAASNISSEEGERARRSRQQNMKMQARLNQLRSSSLTHISAQLSATEANRSLAFLKQHIPENVAIEMGVVQLLLIVDRLRTKATSAAKLLHEFYGLGSSEENIASYSYTVCAKLMDFAASCNQLSWAIRVADLDTFNKMVGERDSLDAADNVLDDLLSVISKDEFNDGTSLEDLDISHENVVGFISAHFPDDPEDLRPSVVLVRRGPPTVQLDVQKHIFEQGACLSKLQAIGDLLAAVPRRQDKDGNSVDDEKVQAFTSVFEQMEQLQNTCLDLCNKTFKSAQRYELTIHNLPSHNPKFVQQEFKMCQKYCLGTQMRLKELLDWLSGVMQNRSIDNDDDESKRRDALIDQIVSRFNVETGEKRLIEELSSSFTVLKQLAEKIDAGEGLSESETLAAPAYEERAQQVREELMQAASVRSALDEASRRAEDKTRELFAVKKMLRESQAKVDVMAAKVNLLQNKSDDSEQLQSKVDMYEKRDQEYSVAIEGLNADIDKYAKLAKQYKNKAIKFKFQLKQVQESRAKGGAGGGGSSGVVTVSGKELNNIQVAADEVNMLSRTVAVLRHQLAETRARIQRDHLSKFLAPLPILGSKVFSSSHHTKTENIAELCKHRASASPFAVASATSEGDVSAVAELQDSVFDLAKRVAVFRSTPVLADVSKPSDGPAGQQWLKRQLDAQKLASDSASVHTKLGEFLSNKKGQAFRSLLASVPATADAVAGGVGVTNTSTAKLLGRLTLPIASSAVPSSQKVVLRPHQFAQLHAVFV